MLAESLPCYFLNVALFVWGLYLKSEALCPEYFACLSFARSSGDMFCLVLPYSVKVSLLGWRIPCFWSRETAMPRAFEFPLAANCEVSLRIMVWPIYFFLAFLNSFSLTSEGTGSHGGGFFLLAKLRAIVVSS